MSKRSRASFSASTTRTAPPDPLGGADVSSAAAPGVGGANVSAGGSPPSRMRAKVPGHCKHCSGACLLRSLGPDGLSQRRINDGAVIAWRANSRCDMPI